ncbi:MAG: hypothetical protein AAF517_06120 [Planctomycetota bacterium]
MAAARHPGQNSTREEMGEGSARNIEEDEQARVAYVVCSLL